MKPSSRVAAGLLLACLPARPPEFVAHAPLTGYCMAPSRAPQALASQSLSLVCEWCPPLCQRFCPLPASSALKSWSASTATAPPLHSQCAIIAPGYRDNRQTCGEPDDKTLRPFREPLSLSHQFTHFLCLPGTCAHPCFLSHLYTPFVGLIQSLSMKAFHIESQTPLPARHRDHVCANLNDHALLLNWRLSVVSGIY